MSEKTYGGQEMVMIDSARRLFIEKGFEDTTMCDIAELAGVNRSTLHYYFPNKDVMFKAVFSSIVETLMPRLREIMSSVLRLWWTSISRGFSRIRRYRAS